LEPLPVNVQKLTALRECNGLDQLRVLPVALDRRDGTANLRLPALQGNSGWGILTKSWDIAETIEVATRMLDSLYDSSRRLSFIKLDVEGAEPRVLEGAGATLRRHRPLVWCEFNDVLLRDAGSSNSELLDHFAGRGYRPAVGFRPSPRHVVDVLMTPQATTGAPGN